MGESRNPLSDLGKSFVDAGVDLSLRYEIACGIGLVMAIMSASAGHILPQPADSVFVWMGIVAGTSSFVFLFYGLRRRYRAIGM